LSGRLVYVIVKVEKAGLKDVLRGLLRRGRLKQRGLSEEAKAALSMLIAEIYDLNPSEEIRRVLDSWVKANDLHPEKVGRLTALEFLRLMGGGAD